MSPNCRLRTVPKVLPKNKGIGANKKAQEGRIARARTRFYTVMTNTTMGDLDFVSMNARAYVHAYTYATMTSVCMCI